MRHLATHGKYKDLFVLKGGTLLSNVYRSPRQSIADADYTYLDPEKPQGAQPRGGPGRERRVRLLALPRGGAAVLAAEKLLGWCGKPLPKHLVDLAYLAREHHEHISREQVAKLVHRKFEMEKGARRYRDAGIRSPADLVAAFTKENKLKDLRNDWEWQAVEVLSPRASLSTYVGRLVGRHLISCHLEDVYSWDMSTTEEYKAELAAFLDGFGHNVRRARLAVNTSQEVLSERTGLHRTEIGRIEQGVVEPRLTTLVILASALGVALDDLVAGLWVPVARKPSPQAGIPASRGVEKRRTS